MLAVGAGCRQPFPRLPRIRFRIVQHLGRLHLYPRGVLALCSEERVLKSSGGWQPIGGDRILLRHVESIRLVLNISVSKSEGIFN